MRRQLLIYLVIFLILSNTFTYMYYKKHTEMLTKKETTASNKSLIDSLQTKIFINSLFSIDNNQMALDYFENKKTGEYLEAEQIKNIIQNNLYVHNEKKTVTQLIDLENMSEKPFIFDSFRVINHRWVVADFTDGKHFGEVFLKYFIEEDKTATFEQVQSVLFK